MREILFRGKRPDNNEWVEGFYVCISGTCHYILTGNPVIACGEINVEYYRVIPETVGRYTGLKDMNGKRIFEGDIFKFDDEVWESYYTSCGTEYDSYPVENYGVVGYDTYYARFDFVDYKYEENSVEADLHENHAIEFADFVRELEVIGNIYDNPELLEVGE